MKSSLVSIIVKKYGLWILLSILWTLIVQSTFYAVQNSQAQNLTRSIHGQLRQDLAAANFHFLSRNLMDLESSKTMKCVRLILKAEKDVKILDTTYRSACDEHDFLLQGAHIQTELRAVNGDIFTLNFISLNSSSFHIALWFIRLIGIIQILIFFLYQKFKAEKDRAIFELEQNHNKKLMEIASQVSHDIRSPLSALSMLIGTLKDLPEDKKTLVLHATQRINDIANNLLQKNTQPSSNTKTISIENTPVNKLNLSIEYIPQILEMLISEKRLQFLDQSNIVIASDFSESFDSFARIDTTEFGRALSNLINNAVESLVDRNGKVTITVNSIKKNATDYIIITIQDTGRGIPEQILNRLGEKGLSFGKDGTQSGSGLGVYHAKATMKAFDGDMIIDSTEGKGTSIKIILPRAQSPDWFAKKINLENIKFLVSLDDDSNMHKLWAEKIVKNAKSKIEHISFTSGNEFETYFNKNIKYLKETLFLIDYDLHNQHRTGLQIIEDLVIEKHTLLVTSRAFEKKIHDQATKRNLKILPKSVADLIPIKF